MTPEERLTVTTQCEMKTTGDERMMGASMTHMIPDRDLRTRIVWRRNGKRWIRDKVPIPGDVSQKALDVFGSLRWNLVEQGNYTVLVMHGRRGSECEVVVSVTKRNPNIDRRSKSIALQVLATRAFRAIINSLMKQSQSIGDLTGGSNASH